MNQISPGIHGHWIGLPGCFQVLPYFLLSLFLALYKTKVITIHGNRTVWEWLRNTSKRGFSDINQYALSSYRPWFMWPTFHEIMGYNLKNARNGKSGSKPSQCPCLRPFALENEILSWRFEFLKHQKVVGKQKAFLSSNIVHGRISSKFSGNSNCQINLLFNARVLKLCHFSI